MRKLQTTYNPCIPRTYTFIMKSCLSCIVALSAAAAAAAAVVAPHPASDQVVLDQSSQADDRYLIELSPGETRWVTEDDKWVLRRVSLHSFFPSRKLTYSS